MSTQKPTSTMTISGSMKVELYQELGKFHTRLIRSYAQDLDDTVASHGKDYLDVDYQMWEDHKISEVFEAQPLYHDGRFTLLILDGLEDPVAKITAQKGGLA